MCSCSRSIDVLSLGWTTRKLGSRLVKSAGLRYNESTQNRKKVNWGLKTVRLVVSVGYFFFFQLLSTEGIV